VSRCKFPPQLRLTEPPVAATYLREQEIVLGRQDKKGMLMTYKMQKLKGKTNWEAYMHTGLIILKWLLRKKYVEPSIGFSELTV
jgi:hypothetical protein